MAEEVRGRENEVRMRNAFSCLHLLILLSRKCQTQKWKMTHFRVVLLKRFCDKNQDPPSEAD